MLPISRREGIKLESETYVMPIVVTSASYRLKMPTVPTLEFAATLTEAFPADTVMFIVAFDSGEVVIITAEACTRRKN